LPAITNTVDIDGTSQPGFVNGGDLMIAIDGLYAGPSTEGLDLQSSHCTVRGLNIRHFSRDGILLEGGGSNAILYCGIGTDRLGKLAMGNAWAGIAVLSPNNSIGQTNLGSVISGNGTVGVLLGGPNAYNNTLQDNYIGNNYLGIAAIPNGQDGVLIDHAYGNIIGGIKNGQGNVISGNTWGGVTFRGAYRNVVENNSIGTDSVSTFGVGNGAGVWLSAGSYDNTIGGATFGMGNVISGNRGDGVSILDRGSDRNVVQGNYIGTNYLSNVALPNGQAGVRIENGATYNVIGGYSTKNEGNVISGNDYFGVVIQDSGTAGNGVYGNHIGIGVGNYAVPNGDGVWLTCGAKYNNIGSPIPAERNIISGNWWHGIAIDGLLTNYNSVQGNYIGVTLDGAAALPNAQSGVEIGAGASSNLIGGLGIARNVISGNTVYGVFLSDAGTTGNMVSGNYIGTDATGMYAVSNGEGVHLAGGASGNVIGVSDAGSGNVISGNGWHGIGVTVHGTMRAMRPSKGFDSLFRDGR
jgi:titin